MAIALHYLQKMFVNGLLRPGDRVLDIGCSNLYGADKDALIDFMSKFGVVDDRFAERLAEESAGKTAFAGQLLDRCGLHYEAIDYVVDYKTTKFDLNIDKLPLPFVGAFDVVMNFGTTEHVINQANSFQIIHDAVKNGGIIYHQLPAAGYFHHCYFLYTGRFFFDLAACNEYAVIAAWLDQNHLSKSDLLDSFRDYVSYFPVLAQSNLVDEHVMSDTSFNVQYRKVKEIAFRYPIELGTAFLKDEVEQLRFDGKEVDLDLQRWVMHQVAGKPEYSDAPLEQVETAVWQLFRESDQDDTGAYLDLAGRFLGTGWGRAGHNSSGQTWRWMGNRGSAVLLKLQKSWNYQIKLAVQKANLPSDLDGIRVKVNDRDVASSNRHFEDGRYFVVFQIPAASVEEFKGRVKISLDAAPDSGIAFASLQVHPLQEVEPEVEPKEGPDVSLEQWVMQQTAGDAQDSDLPVEPVEVAAWRFFRAYEGDDTGGSVDLAGRFLGAGWGHADQNRAGQRWRWIEGGRSAFVFIKLPLGKTRQIKMAVHDANSTSALDSVRVNVNEQEVASSNRHFEDGRYFVVFYIPAATVDEFQGKVKISLQVAPDARIAFTSLHIHPVEEAKSHVASEAKAD